MDPTLLTIILIAAFLAIAGLIWVLLRTRRPDPAAFLLQQQMEALREQMGKTLEGNAQLLNQQMGQLQTRLQDDLDRVSRTVNERLRESGELIQATHRTLGERLDNASRVVGNVHSSLGKLEEATRHVHEVGKNIASLQEILQTPKLRGNLGELFLGDLLSQILPPEHYSLQHTFRSGEKVDAAIHLGGGLVPVDAKFPLENFRRIVAAEGEEPKRAARKAFTADVKRHVDAIATKYIVPDEGTFDFALMYIPAENIYYETIIKDEAFGADRSICEYAISRRVIPVSPNSFYAYLQAILLGLKGLRIEESAKEIIQHLARLRGDFARFREDFRLLGKHLGNARSSYDNALRDMDRLGGKLEQIEQQSPVAKSIGTGQNPQALPPEDSVQSD